MPLFYPPLLITGQKFTSPWAYIREHLSGSEIQNLKNLLINPWAYMLICRGIGYINTVYILKCVAIGAV